MLCEIIPELLGKRVVVSAAPGNGASSFALYMLNTILKEEDKLVLYYNPTADIDRNFVEQYYPRAYKESVWLTCDLNSFLEYFQFSSDQYDCLVIDPGDMTLVQPDILPALGQLKNKDTTLIITSQIRQDPNKGWAPYSTVERLNSFDYSIWITNVTDTHPIFRRKYVDVYSEIKAGNNFVMRDIASYAREGNIVETR